MALWLRRVLWIVSSLLLGFVCRRNWGFVVYLDWFRHEGLIFGSLDGNDNGKKRRQIILEKLSVTTGD